MDNLNRLNIMKKGSSVQKLNYFCSMRTNGDTIIKAKKSKSHRAVI